MLSWKLGEGKGEKPTETFEGSQSAGSLSGSAEVVNPPCPLAQLSWGGCVDACLEGSIACLEGSIAGEFQMT